MKVLFFIFGILSAVSLVGLTSCGKKEELVHVETTRPRLSTDKLPPNYVPREWKMTGATIPGAKIRNERFLNYQFGETGEIYVSAVKGDLLGNADRWVGQFGESKRESLEAYPTLNFGGAEAVYVECYGTYTGRKKDWGMHGVLYQQGEYIISVKMLGSAEEVKAQKENFALFCKHYNSYKKEVKGE